MKFAAPQYARGVKELSLIHSEGGDDDLWSTLQSHFKEVPSDFDLSSNLPLGKQTERYVSQMIKSSSRFELILENCQVIENKKTIGELDFIIKDVERDTFIHLELAIKFYLDKEKEWVGPNLKDRLDLKIEKYHTHQKKLIQNLTVKNILKEFNINAIQSQLLIIGQLYLNQDNNSKLNQKWISISEFAQSQEVNSKYYIPTKKDWLIGPSENVTWYSIDEMIQELNEAIRAERSQLIWMKNTKGDCLRFFVTWW